MLVDMAGSENIEQAGQTGFEAKMQVHCQKERKKKYQTLLHISCLSHSLTPCSGLLKIFS